MIYKYKTNKVFSVQCGVKRITQHTQFCSLSFQKKTLQRHTQSNLLIGTRDFYFTTSCPQYLRRISNHYFLRSTLTTYTKFREKRFGCYEFFLQMITEIYLIYLTEGFPLFRPLFILVYSI